MMNGNPISKRQKAAWVWFAYTSFLFIEPIVEPSWHRWIIALTSLAVFIVIFTVYVRAMESGSRVAHWMIAATFALGLITFPWNGGATTFFIYTAAFLPFSIRSAKRVLSLFLVEALFVLAESHFFYHGLGNAFFAIFLLLVVGGSNIFLAEQRTAENRLLAAQEENIALAAVAERERIARDLHDVLGHTLSVIVLKAELAGRLVERDPQRAAAEIGDVERTARTALAEVREAIGGYRARGLAAEIETARRTLDAAGVTLLSNTEHAVATGLSSTEETVLSLALREAVTNIVRHARATTCRLHFVSENGHRRLVVEDNGEHAITREGNGLRGMRERIESIGGHLSLDRESGTRLLIDLPLRAESVVS
ncbi:MAG TPA: sensor histidine kinase [Granulicella sp.]|jgi:two-component system sensor histidine kinase DesK